MGTRAILIEGAAQTVTEIECGGFDDLCVLLGGDFLLTVNALLPNGDTMYCHVDWLFNSRAGFFIFAGDAWPIGGRAVVVGAEWWDDDDDHLRYRNPQSTVESITAGVKFLTRDQLDTLAQFHASDPPTAMTTYGDEAMLGDDGDADWGSLTAGLLRRTVFVRKLLDPGHGSRKGRAATVSCFYRRLDPFPPPMLRHPA